MKKMIAIALVLLLSLTSAMALADVNVIMRNNGNAESNDNTIANKLNEILGFTVNWDLRSADNYNSQCALVISSGEYPDAMEFWPTNYPGDLQDLADAGVIRPLNDLLDQYGANIKANRKDNSYFVSETDGLIYGINSRFSDVPTSEIILIRTDWLEKLGLEKPDNVEDFYNVLVAFKNNAELLLGADKASQLIPYGTSDGSDRKALLYYIMSEYGVVNDWVMKDGELVYFINTQEYHDALKLYRQMYQEGLVDAEFPLLDSSGLRAKLYTGVIGSWNWFLDSSGANNNRMIEFYGMNPTATVDFLYHFPDSNGVRHTSGSASRTAYLIVFSKATDEAAAQAIQLADYVISDPGFILTEIGLEGEHWTYDEAGNIVTNKLAVDQMREMGYGTYRYFMRQKMTQLPGTLPFVKDAAAFISQYGTEQLFPMTDSYVQNIVVLRDLRESYEAKLVVSDDIDFEAVFQEYIEAWNNAGGAQWTQEMNDLHNQ